jgi:hypothetical protein
VISVWREKSVKIIFDAADKVNESRASYFAQDFGRLMTRRYFEFARRLYLNIGHSQSPC